MSQRIGSRQALVDLVFLQCMEQDIRHREDILDKLERRLRVEQQLELREGQPSMPLQGWEPTRYELTVALSRVASRGVGKRRRVRRFFPCYNEPHRFLDLERLEQLQAKVEKGEADEGEQRRFLAMLQDLRDVEHSWKRDEDNVRKQREVLTELLVDGELAASSSNMLAVQHPAT